MGRIFVSCFKGDKVACKSQALKRIAVVEEKRWKTASTIEKLRWTG